MAILRRAVVLTLLMALLVVACQPAGPTFRTTLPAEEGDPLPVTLTDETGLVTGIAPAEVDVAWSFLVPTLHADSDDPNTSVLGWLGGSCDQDTTVWFGVLNGGYVLSVAVHEKSGFGGCSGAAVLRAIRIATSRPIPVDSVTVAGG